MHDNDYHEHVPGVRKAAGRRPEPAPAPEVNPLHQVGNRAFTRHVQRSGERSQGAGPLDSGIESDIRSARGGGRPLDDHVRDDMESHLGVDLASVRVHADGRGDALSRSVQADAFTTGTDVFFRAGRYAPDSSEGRKLLAHELTHVVQQSSGAVGAESRVSHPDDPHEREAGAVADSVAASAPATAQRQVAPEAMEEEDEEAAIAPSRQATEEEELDEEEAGKT